jgi:alpha-D-ribose 1-methylphosphonate 5-triphosphate synthase subunit PhnG
MNAQENAGPSQDFLSPPGGGRPVAARGQSIPRTDWPRLWSALPADEIKAAAEACARNCRVEDISLPQSGLSLVKLRDAALLDEWFLGEIPLARAHVRLHDSDGRAAEGGVQILDDRARLARQMAILDAVLSARLPGWEQPQALLVKGRAVREQERAERQAMLAATRVDFAMLNAVEDDDA